jgi:hypothetical protein
VIVLPSATANRLTADLSVRNPNTAAMGKAETRARGRGGGGGGVDGGGNPGYELPAPSFSARAYGISV